MNQWQIAVDAPITKPLTYTSEDPSIAVGSLVKVPLGKSNRKVFGLCLEKTMDNEERLKTIAHVYQDLPHIPSRYVDWLSWLSNYYKHPIGQVAKLLAPPLIDKKQGRSRKKSPIPDVEPESIAELNAEQMAAYKSISASNGFQCHLLHGVTGSGKTEVYIHLFQQALNSGKKGLFLVPEISLTPQLLSRFARVFGDQLAVMHSQLTERERTNQWLSIVEGDKKILLGARSALFCPIPDLGLIIVDEEHEASYKQEEKLKYHARDSAIMLAAKLEIPIVLGSATPSLESWQNAKAGKYQLHQLQLRFNEKSLPQIDVVDLREHRPAGLPFWMSQELHDALVQNLKNKEQSALFLNRRGMAPSVVCNSCGHTEECPNCAVALTLHHKHHLHCHYCDYHKNFNETCSACGVGEVIPLGLGTEKMQEDIKEMFPEARVVRADRDEIQSREDMEAVIQAVESQSVDILIGTQMISKGLDFPHLSLVSVVLADIGFNIQDFRANEKTYQLLSQVAGRSGRHNTDGRVIIQTYNPNHPCLPFVIEHSYEAFADRELLHRKELLYPPFSRMIRIRNQSIFAKKAEKNIMDIYNWLQKAFKHYQIENDVQILGPTEAPLFKLRGKYRYHMLLKVKNKKNIHSILDQLLANDALFPSGTKVLIDVDPIQMG